MRICSRCDCVLESFKRCHLFSFQLDGCVFIMLKSLLVYGVLGGKDVWTKSVICGRLQHTFLSLPCWCVLCFFLSQFCWFQQSATKFLCALKITKTWKWIVCLSLNPTRTTLINSLGPLVTKNRSSTPMSQDHSQITTSKAKARFKNWSLTATGWPCLISRTSFSVTQPSHANCLQSQPLALLWRRVGKRLHLCDHKNMWLR